MKPVGREQTHGGVAPVKLIGDAELLHHLESGVVSLAYEVIEPLDRHSLEVKVPGHATRFRGCLQEIDIVAVLCRPIGCSEAHSTRSNYDNPHTAPRFFC